MRSFFVLILLVLSLFTLSTQVVQPVQAWGFSVHAEVAHQALEQLPEEIQEVFSPYLSYLASASVDADRRKSSDPAEAGRHYDDQDEPHQDRNVPFPSRNWSLGVVAWAAENATRDLITALQGGNLVEIMRYMGDTAHYISDAAQPLHATKNYDGQLTGNSGIHGRFETEVIQRNFEDAFNLTDFEAPRIIPDAYLMVEDQIASGLALVPEVLAADDAAREDIESADEYYVTLYNLTRHIIKDRLKLAITNTAHIWYTAMVNASWIDISGETTEFSIPELTISTTGTSTPSTSSNLSSTTSIIHSSQTSNSSQTSPSSSLISSTEPSPLPTMVLAISLLLLPLLHHRKRKIE